MKIRYLRTVEDFLALKDTDTKIYNGSNRTGCHYQFVNGCFCRLDNNGDFIFNVGIAVNGQDFYIEEESEEPVQEATAEDVGKLCWFFDDDEERKYISKLTKKYISADFRFEDCFGDSWKHCRPLTKAEIQEFMEKAE